MSTLAPQSINHPLRFASEWVPSPALLRFAKGRVRDNWYGRIASWVGGCVFVASSVLVYLGGGAEQSGLGEVVELALLATSWSAGIVAAIGAARPFTDDDAREGVLRMLGVRGIASARLAHAYWVATIMRIAALVALPPLALWGLALVLTPSLAVLVRHSLLGGAILVYALVFATVLGSIVRWVAVWHPARPRTLLLAVIAVPYLLRLVWPAIPSLPAFASELATRLTSLALGGSWVN